MFKHLIANAVAIALGISENEIENLIGYAPENSFGDYALPCFSFSKALRKSPMIIASELEKTITLPKEIERCEAVNGYLNFFVDKTAFNKYVLDEILLNKKYGSGKLGENKTCLIEHTSTNPNASPHIGRARNAMIGDFVTRLMRFEGYKTDVHYFVNDIGKQISMLVLGSKDKENIEFQDILKLYIDINEKVKEDPSLEQEVFDLLYRLEQGEQTAVNDFRRIVDICIKGQIAILNEFGISYDHFDYESQFLRDNSMQNILKVLEDKKYLFEDDQNRLVVNLDEFKLSPLVVARGNKTSLYPLRDLAYTQQKCSKNADKNIIILGEDQKLYFKQIATITSILGFVPPQVIHYAFVLLAEGKMSTRNGTVVLLEDLMREAIEKVSEKIKASGRDLPEKTVKAIAYGTIKYSILKASNDKNVIFDWESALSFEGDTAPYIQYSFARICSILRKANFDYSNYDAKYLTSPIEFDVIKQMSLFPEIIKTLHKDYSPHTLCVYVYALAKKFSNFYHDLKILNEEDSNVKNARLNLLIALKQIFETSLNLLGIDTIEEM